MEHLPGMARPELQALPQIKDRMTFCIWSVWCRTFVHCCLEKRSQSLKMSYTFGMIREHFFKAEDLME